MEWFVNLQFVSKQSIFSFDSISVRDFYTPDNDIWLLDCVKGSVFGLDKSSLKALICSAFVDIPSVLLFLSRTNSIIQNSQQHKTIMDGGIRSKIPFFSRVNFAKFI